MVRRGDAAAVGATCRWREAPLEERKFCLWMAVCVSAVQTAWSHHHRVKQRMECKQGHIRSLTRLQVHHQIRTEVSLRLAYMPSLLQEYSVAGMCLGSPPCSTAPLPFLSPRPRHNGCWFLRDAHLRLLHQLVLCLYRPVHHLHGMTLVMRQRSPKGPADTPTTGSILSLSF